MLIRDLHKLTGGLGQPSKMPGYAYGLDARTCILGAILHRQKGSVCHRCYALGKGNYGFPCVRNAQANRLESISKPEWVEWMTELLSKKYRNRKGWDRVFRWHDAGDIQGLEHLSKIVAIAKNLPDIRFWIPTRERKIVREYLSTYGKFPRNLIVRLSAQMVGQTEKNLPGTVSSSVDSGKGFQCPAPKQGNACVSCRACWNKTIKLVDYHAH